MTLNYRFSKRLEKLLENTGDMALKRRARKIIEGLDLKDGDTILDVGCGDGYYIYLLSNLGFNLKLKGADFDKSALRSARRNLKNKKISLVRADLMKHLPFKANSFDKVVMSEVAEHLPDDVKGLKEVKRVLKKDGILVLTVPNHNYPLFWDPVNWILEHLFNTHIKAGFWAGLWNQHIRLYKPKQIKKSAQQAGFKVKKVESMTFWCLPFNHNLVNLMARRLYGGKLSPKISKAVSKYEVSTRKPFLLKTLFSFVNTIDKLNDLYSPKNIGVGILVKAVK